MAGCSVCDSDPKSCDVCKEEGAKFDEGQSKCIVEDDGEGAWLDVWGGIISDVSGLCMFEVVKLCMVTICGMVDVFI